MNHPYQFSCQNQTEFYINPSAKREAAVGQNFINTSSYSVPYNSVDSYSKPNSNIHINPLKCGSRNIYVNKALYYAKVEGNASNPLRKKTERVYYNRKFLTGRTVLESQAVNSNLPRKHESNIYLNPRFIKNEVNRSETAAVTAPLNKAVVPSQIFQNKISSGIHVNPKFLQDRTQHSDKGIEKNIFENREKDDQNKEYNPDQSKSSSLVTPRPKFISKYKIVRKRVSSPTVSSSQLNFSKGGLKKVNAQGKKCKLKHCKEKLLTAKSPCDRSKYTYINKHALRTYTSPKATIYSLKKYKSNIHLLQKSPMKMKRTAAYEAKIIALRKSLLQRKIEARRRGKLLAGSNILNNAYYSKYKYRNPELMKFNKHTKSVYSNRHCYCKVNTISNKASLSTDKLSDFKNINRMKLVRKSILQAQIESRRRVKKISLQQQYQKRAENQISKYKIVRATTISKKAASSNKKTTLRRNNLKFSSDKYRADKSKRLATLTKKLRKNNQPCPFYGRYGRCKGKEKGTCPKLHDQRYISICKKFLKGDCKDGDCTLSHDVRPEKMPTCHHYLAGLCQRTNCPYLHIKVNQKAPICRAFLQGFCADVFNCTKRHEFICPMFAEKGQCPKGKSCSLPHRTSTTCSKLLEPDQFPILNKKFKKKDHPKEVSITDKHLSRESIPEKEVTDDDKSKQTKVKEFQRYFLAPLSVDELNENDNSTLAELPASDI